MYTCITHMHVNIYVLPCSSRIIALPKQILLRNPKHTMNQMHGQRGTLQPKPTGNKTSCTNILHFSCICTLRENKMLRAGDYIGDMALVGVSDWAESTCFDMSADQGGENTEIRVRPPPP